MVEQIIDEFFMNSIIMSPTDYNNKNNIILNVVQSSLKQMHQQQTTLVAIKMVQKKLTKSVTKKLITQIIQESTDAIYKFEDDSISIADILLKEVLNKQMREIAHESIIES